MSKVKTLKQIESVELLENIYSKLRQSNDTVKGMFKTGGVYNPVILEDIDNKLTMVVRVLSQLSKETA